MRVPALAALLHPQPAVAFGAGGALAVLGGAAVDRHQLLAPGEGVDQALHDRTDTHAVSDRDRADHVRPQVLRAVCGVMQPHHRSPSSPWSPVSSWSRTSRHRCSAAECSYGLVAVGFGGAAPDAVFLAHRQRSGQAGPLCWAALADLDQFGDDLGGGRCGEPVVVGELAAQRLVLPADLDTADQRLAFGGVHRPLVGAGRGEAHAAAPGPRLSGCARSPSMAYWSAKAVMWASVMWANRTRTGSAMPSRAT